MIPLTRLLCIAALLPAFICARTPATEQPVDFDKARQLFERQKSGGTLTAEESAYLERAKAARAGKSHPASADGIDWDRAQALHRRASAGETLSSEDQAYYEKAKQAMSRRGGDKRGKDGARAEQRKAPDHLTPLTDMTADARYEGEDGGLYGGGSNVPPESLRTAALAALKQIQPLDATGQPAATGKIAFVSISMSNATQEFSTFKPMADASPLKSPQVVIVDCAQGGQAMAQWVPADGKPWQEAMSRIEHAQVSPQQVQVAWVKLANVAPGGSM